MADDDRQRQFQSQSESRMQPALIGAVILAAAFAAFILQNTDDVPIKWLFFEPEMPLWLLLLVTSAIAIVAAELAGWAIRRRRRD